MLGTRRLAEPWICVRCFHKARATATQGLISRRTLTARHDAVKARSWSITDFVATKNPSLLIERPSSASAARPLAEDADPYFEATGASKTHKGGIRKHLADWQQEHGIRNVDYPPALPPNEDSDGITNDSMHLQRSGALLEAGPGHGEDIREDHLISTSEDLAGFEYEYLAPGDLVEVRTAHNRRPLIGIFVRELGDNLAQIFTTSGNWFHVQSKSIPFSIPGFMDPALLTSILPYLPQHANTTELEQIMHLVDVGVPREVSSPILKLLVQFSNEVEQLYRDNAAALDSAHQILAHEKDLRFGTLEKIAKKLLGISGHAGQPSDAALVAVRRALLRSQGFAADVRSHRLTRVFLIHPKEHIADIETAADWIRQWQDSQASLSQHSETMSIPTAAGKVDNFIRKARSLVDKGRALRPENDYTSVSPSSLQHPITMEEDGYRVIPSLQFSDSDRVLIRFLESASLGRSFFEHKQYNALAVRLVRAVDRTSDSVGYTQQGTYKLLQEIGSIKPYENRALHDEHILLPTSQRSKPLMRLRDAINTSGPRAEATLKDTMQHLRHDWRGLTVYAIDSATTLNIDDGISIEPVPGRSDEWWIRVHIANPTARLGKDHDVSRMAAHMTGTYYAPDDHHWLLPLWITQKFMSLAPNRPVLTFSARVGRDCAILEYNVQPGTIRDVVKLTPRALSTLLGRNATQADSTVLAVGHARHWSEGLHGTGAIPSMTEAQIKELATLSDLAVARARHRIVNGGMLTVDTRPSVSATYSIRQGAPLVSQLSLPAEAAHFMEGDPAIRMMCNHDPGEFEVGITHTQNDSMLVQEMMLIAGEVAARWCSERNIPILYRGTFSHKSAESVFSAAEFYQAYLKPHIDRTGKVPKQLIFAWMRLVGRTATMLTPTHHVFSGLDQYAKVTTPLGRYGDMIAHWQIESALREEARTGKSLVGSKKEDYLAFTRAELNPVIPRLRAREQLISRSSENCMLHWICALFFRAHHFHEAELPATHEVIIHGGHQSKGKNCLGYSTMYGGVVFDVAMPAEAFKTDAHEAYGRAGDRWEVEIELVDPVLRVIRTRPLRLLHREPYTPDDLLKSDWSARFM